MPWWWLACGGPLPAEDPGDHSASPPSSGESPALSVSASAGPPHAPLAVTLRLQADRPVAGSIAWDGRRVEVVEPSSDWSVTLLGFEEGTSAEIRVAATDTSGRQADRQVRVDLPAAPAHLPRGERVASVPGAGGDTLVPLRVAEGEGPWPGDVAAVYDAAGRLVYWQAVDDELMDVRAGADGLHAVVGVERSRLVHLGWDGALLGSWALPPAEGAGTTVATSWTGRLHHDGGPVPDGSGRLLALARRPMTVDDYPASYQDPTLTRRRTVADDVVLLFGPDGAVEREARLSAVIPTSRVGYGSLELTAEGWADWAHANSVEWQPDGSALVSLRHQDLVVALEPDGSLRWLFGHDVNLSPDLQALRLRPVGEVAHPWHPHGAHLAPPAPDGSRLLTLFDNGNEQAAPFTDQPRVRDPALLESRVVGYRVDAAARTVEQAWSFPHPDGPLFSEAVGDADPLPGGRVLAVWGFLDRGPDGVSNLEAGLGRRSARVVELEPPPAGASGVPVRVWELLLATDREDHPWGWSAARAQRLDLQAP